MPKSNSLVLELSQFFHETRNSWLLVLIWSSSTLVLVCDATSQSIQFSDACDLSQPCDISQGLACISNICQCGSPSNQRFDNVSKKCVSVVGGPCTTTIEGNLRKECIPNAYCAEKRDESGEMYTECQCDKGYIENSSGDCVPGIGQPCSYLPEECNPLGMVVCKNGKCQCLDDLQVYDVDMQRCVSPAGTHCKYERATSSLQLGCVKNAICYPFFYWIPPKCLCKPGYVQTKSRQCVPEPDYNRSHGTGSSGGHNHNHNGGGGGNENDHHTNHHNSNHQSLSRQHPSSWQATSSASSTLSSQSVQV